MLHWAAQGGHAEMAQFVINEFKLEPTAHDKVCLFMGVCVSVFVSVCACVSRQHSSAVYVGMAVVIGML